METTKTIRTKVVRKLNQSEIFDAILTWAAALDEDPSDIEINFNDYSSMYEAIITTETVQ